MRFIWLSALSLIFIALAFPADAQGRVLFDPAAIKAFYEQRGEEFYWQDAGGLTPGGETLLATLENSWKHGLNPVTYHAEKIRALLQERDADNAARLEILLTDGYIRYFRDMSGMRIKPEDFGMDPEDWLRPYSVQEGLSVLSAHTNIKAVLDALPPKSQTYRALQIELERLVRGAPEPYLYVLPISFGDVLLTPAQRHKRVPDLRLRLGVAAQTNDLYLYDDRLAGAVMKFQRESGLPPDGLVGPTTLKLLNRTNHDKMLQIVANLERLRWVDENRPARFVLVNIPAATLWAVDNQKVAFQMRVVVGRKQRQTQSFIADIEGVRFNPGWTVPPTIKREDILPKLRENPDYLTDKGMELIQNTSEGPVTIDPDSVDWHRITNQELRGLDMVQIPGVHNPLGTIRILMPNRYNIYLHDTNERQYFDRTLRAQSSGCIRMQDPAKMAAFVMAGTKGWSAEKMESLIADGKTHDVKIANPIPVYILYYSAWTDEYGRIIFGNDIYDLDKKLIRELSAIDGFTLPGHNEDAPEKAGPERP
jgi:murein L,D-transpeptidase YcbB/YkuD